MRLLKIETKNFRTLQNVKINFLSNYCTISGKNNAGKSSIIKLFLNLSQKESSRWLDEDFSFDYKDDKTQWIKSQENINVYYEFEISKQDDPAFITFLEKISSKQIETNKSILTMHLTISSIDNILTKTKINNLELDPQVSSEIFSKLRNSNFLFHHNSAGGEDVYLGRGWKKSLYEVLLSDVEQKQLSKAAKTLESKIKKLAREHKENLNLLLGRLVEKYDVEFSVLQKYISRRHIFGVTLNDKKVEVPLNDWGSGTQNRTHILISILHAKRIKDKESSQDKITPIVVIEEPESFLHPSAQSEFGKILRDLSLELGIQIIVTTHSPYMLNREDPSSNTLLSRVHRKRKNPETVVVDTSGANWMMPFAEHLGIPMSELKELKSLFFKAQKVLLVEGDIDKDYFEFLREHPIGTDVLDPDIAIIPYGGYGTLTNGLSLKFILSNYEKFLITFDLDAFSKVKKTLEGIGLKEKTDFLSVGLPKPGYESIEGLLPNRILASVHGCHTELVMKLSNPDHERRKEAKDELKKLLLTEFKKHRDYKIDETKELSKLIKTINEKFY